MEARTPLVTVVALALLITPAMALANDPIDAVPQVTDGFTLSLVSAVPVPTAIAFGPPAASPLPGVTDEVVEVPDLYATSLDGSVYRVDLTWTPAGPVAGPIEAVVSGFSQPLGLAFDGDGTLYVAASEPAELPGRGVDGVVYRVDEDGTRTAVVDNLPNGRHNTNHLRFAPDGRLFITNGNPNDNGIAGGAADVFPYSGAILAVDAAAVGADPAVLQWFDDNDDAIPADQVGDHPVNADFADKVDVVGYGFRNVYGVAFGPGGVPYTATNGADDPSSQDLLQRLDDGPDTFYGFPYCYNRGPPGGTGDEVFVENNPLFPDADCTDIEPATALLGWHVCATGIDITPEVSIQGSVGDFGNAAYIGECGPFFLPDTLAQEDAVSTHNTGHKVVRVDLDDQGEATGVRDFVTGLALPTDVLFGPDGALYIADVEAVHRVAPV